MCVCVCVCVNEMHTFVGLCKALWALTRWGVINHDIYMTLFVMFYHSVFLSVWVAVTDVITGNRGEVLLKQGTSMNTDHAPILQTFEDKNE